MVLLLHLLPLLAAGLAVEGFSLVRWGERRGDFDIVARFSLPEVLWYSATQFVLIVASIFVGAKFLQWATHSFQVKASYPPCFTLLAYGFSTILLARFLDALPGLNTWVCWTSGAALSCSVLYHGVALTLRPEQTKGFGLYLVSVIIVLLSSSLTHFIAVSVLHGALTD